MRIALAADHGGFDMKTTLLARLSTAGHDVSDFGASAPDPEDDTVVATALAAKAEVVVTGNQSQLAVAEHQGVRIVDTAAALLLITHATRAAKSGSPPSRFRN